jgi:hypothetical protein
VRDTVPDMRITEEQFQSLLSSMDEEDERDGMESALRVVLEQYETMRQKPRLGGVAEIAYELHQGKSTVGNWAMRREVNGYPLPYISLTMGDVYDLDEVANWRQSYTPTRTIVRRGTIPA